MTERVHCRDCGDLIGVYEPIVTVREGSVSETSRAARPDESFLLLQCFHRECYERRGESLRASG